MYDSVIIRPIITEKSLKDATSGKFTFAVQKSADKQTIKQAVQGKFSVHVIAVATNITKGKGRKTGKRRVEIKKSPMKKAIVSLAKGEKIALFEVGAK